MFFLSASQTSSPLEEPQQTFPLALPFAVPVLERLFLPGGQLEWFCWYFGSSSIRRHLLQHHGLGAPGKPPVSVCLQVPRGHAAFHWPPAQLLQPGYKSGCRMDMGLKPETSTLLCPWSSQERFGASPNLQLRSSIHPCLPQNLAAVPAASTSAPMCLCNLIFIPSIVISLQPRGKDNLSEQSCWQRGCPKSTRGVGERDGAMPPSQEGWLRLWMSVLLQHTHTKNYLFRLEN